MAFQAAGHIGRDEGQDTVVGWLRNGMPKPGKGHAAGAVPIDQGRHAGLHADYVGVEPEAAAVMLIDMGMRVDHAGYHQAIADVDGLGRGIRQDILLHRSDPTVGHGDVHHPIDAHRRVDHMPALKNLRLRRHLIASA